MLTEGIRVTMNVVGQLETDCPADTSFFFVKTGRSILLQFKEKSQFLRISHILPCKAVVGFFFQREFFQQPSWAVLAVRICCGLCSSLIKWFIIFVLSLTVYFKQTQVFLKANKKTFSHCFQEISLEPSAE